jgi:hypothetical protein
MSLSVSDDRWDRHALIKLMVPVLGPAEPVCTWVEGSLHDLDRWPTGCCVCPNRQRLPNARTIRRHRMRNGVAFLMITVNECFVWHVDQCHARSDQQRCSEKTVGATCR